MKNTKPSLFSVIIQWSVFGLLITSAFTLFFILVVVSIHIANLEADLPVVEEKKCVDGFVMYREDKSSMWQSSIFPVRCHPEDKEAP